MLQVQKEVETKMRKQCQGCTNLVLLIRLLFKGVHNLKEFERFYWEGSADLLIDYTLTSLFEAFFD